MPIPEDRFEHNLTDRTPADSPDGRSHVCMPPIYGVYNVLVCHTRVRWVTQQKD